MSRVLFATSNGTGLGHLTRVMAIARRLGSEHEPIVLTLSQAAPVVAAEGIDVEYLPSYRRPGSGSDWQWNLRLRRRLEGLLAELRPQLLVFDGVHPYRALTHVLTHGDGAPTAIWSRRPMWRPGAGEAALKREGAFDAVLEPGELAAGADRGLTVAARDRAHRVAPIVHLGRDELLDREAAERELGLEPGGGPNAFVSLGQGGALDEAVATVLSRLTAIDGLRVVALSSSLSPALDVPPGVVHQRATFPVSRLYSAFDLAVSAAGYNAFHELVGFGVPTLFVPMGRETDDQPARARWAAEQGLGMAVEGPLDAGLGDAVTRLADPAERQALRLRLQRLDPLEGADEAAAWLRAVLAGEEPQPVTRSGGSLVRWLRYSTHPAGPSLPLALGLTARDLLAHPERRRPQLVCLAIGLAEGELAPAVAAAIERAGAEPARTLVVTDSLEFAALRALGVGFERIPDPAQYARREPGGEWSGFAAARLGAILAGRGAARIRVLGEVPPRLLAAAEELSPGPVGERG